MLVEEQPTEYTLFVVRLKDGGEPVVLLVLRPGRFGGEHSRLCLPTFGGYSLFGEQTEDKAIRALFDLAPVDEEVAYSEPKLTDRIWPGRRLVLDSGSTARVRLEEIELPPERLEGILVDLDSYHEYSGGSRNAPVFRAVRMPQLVRVSDPIALAALVLYASRPASGPG